MPYHTLTILYKISGKKREFRNQKAVQKPATASLKCSKPMEDPLISFPNRWCLTTSDHLHVWSSHLAYQIQPPPPTTTPANKIKGHPWRSLHIAKCIPAPNWPKCDLPCWHACGKKYNQTRKKCTLILFTRALYRKMQEVAWRDYAKQQHFVHQL